MKELTELIALINEENTRLQAELDMEAAICKAVASGRLSCDPNFDWRDLEMQ